jgi:aminopeptidase N
VNLRAAAVAWLGALALNAAAADPAPGVSLELAQVRAATISAVSYRLHLDLPERVDAPITGEIEIELTLADASQPLVLDFAAPPERVLALSANGRATDARVVNEHIVVPPAALRRGRNRIAVRFVAGDGPLNRGPDLLYTLFVPARAREAVPCFDQPDLKGRWSLTLDHPAAWKSVANGAELARAERAGRARVRFATTPPLPTYVFAFAAGRFEVVDGPPGGRPMRLFHRENDLALLERNRAALFDLHARALDFLEAYTGVPHPFDKVDMVLLPALQVGAMEHPGAILYRSQGLLLEAAATPAEQRDRARVIGHELAHMWFGNLVTMRWFDDVWTKEVFAESLGVAFADTQFAGDDEATAFLLNNHPAAYGNDRNPAAQALARTLPNLNLAGQMYGPLAYSKAPILMRHLADRLGPVAMRDGVRDYVKRFAWGNATWAELAELLDARSPVDVAAWNRAWVATPGRPRIGVEIEADGDRVRRIVVRQSDPSGRGQRWPQELRVLIGRAGQWTTVRVALEGEVAELPGLAGTPLPDVVLAAGGGWGYADFVPDARSLAWLQSSLAEIPAPVDRAAAWLTLWDAVLEARLGPADWFATVQRALPRETDRQVVTEVLGQIGTLWARYLAPERRDAMAPTIEAFLRAGIERASDPGAKAAWFGALVEVVQTPATLAWLRGVWAAPDSVPGLPLAEPELTRLALTLAVRGADDPAALLQGQLARVTNPDRQARLRFLIPAASADPAERERWFEALREPAARRREPWVLAGLDLLNDPLREAHARRFVPRLLAMLGEIHATGDLFFPEDWLAFGLGGHGSPEVAAAVRAHADALPPDVPPALRPLLLRMADPVQRAATLRARAAP